MPEWDALEDKLTYFDARMGSARGQVDILRVRGEDLSGQVDILRVRGGDLSDHRQEALPGLRICAQSHEAHRLEETVSDSPH